MKPKPPWEEESGVQVLRLYRTEAHPDWPRHVNKAHLHPDWPRIVLLDLSAEQFREFDQNPLAFAEKYNLYPEQKPLWVSACAKPPLGQGIPQATNPARWTVAMIHTPESTIGCAACPQTTTG